MTNTVPISPSAFDQGAVRLSSDSLANYITTTESRNRARADAFNKYLLEQGNNINEKGVRAQDLPAIIDAKNQWQQHAIANRRPIQSLNDHGVALGQNQKLFSNVNDLIRQSQAAAANNKEFEDIQKDPKKAALLTDESLQAFHKSQLPINQGHEPMDLSGIYNPKPFDNNRLARDVNRIHASYVPGEPTPTTGGMQTIKSTKTFTPEDLGALQIRGNYEYNHDNSFKKYIDDNVADHDSTLYHQLNDVYKQHYGKDIMMPEEAATAYMLSLHGEPGSKTQTMKAPVVKPTADEKFNEFKRRTDYRNAHRPAKATTGKAADVATPGEDDWNSLVNQAQKSPPASLNHYEGNKLVSSEKEYILPSTPEVLKKFGVTDPLTKKTLYPKELRISEDGKSVRPLYTNSDASETGNQGVVKLFSKQYPIDKVKDVYVGTKYGKPQMTKEKKILSTKQANNDPLGILK